MPSIDDRRPRFRIGLHIGDVIEKPDGTVFGDGTSVAVRKEELADHDGNSVSELIRTAVQEPTLSAATAKLEISLVKDYCPRGFSADTWVCP